MILWPGPSTRAEPYGLPLGPHGAYRSKASSSRNLTSTPGSTTPAPIG